jgi:hypothetical protein
MKVLKGFAISILGILLFLSLSVFGIAFTVKQTVLNPNFIAAEINKFPLSSIVLQITASEMDIPAELKTSLDKTIVAMEPQLKQQAGAAVKSVYSYLLGKKASPELAKTLRSTLLSDSFAYSLIDNIDITWYGTEVIRQQLNDQGIPAALLPLLDRIEPILVKAEPQIKIQLKAAVPFVLDYLLGQTDGFTASFNLNAGVEDIKVEAKIILRDNPAFAGMTDAQLNAYIDNNLSPQLADINSSLTLDQTSLGTDAQFTKAIQEAEDSLAQVRPYTVMFQQYYIWLIIFIVLLIAGIAAIHRSTKGATRSLGSIFLSYGIIEFVSLLIFRLYVAPKFVFPEITANVPTDLAKFTRQSIFDFMSPLWWFSLGCLIAGVALLVVSFVYRPAEKAKTEPPATIESTPQS